MKKKAYEGHETIYRKMKANGISSWGQAGSGTTGKSDDPAINNFLRDVLGQPWSARSGRVIELGCGTGTILRRVCRNKYSGVGVDVSRTAIAMAREQSGGNNLEFRHGDVCSMDIKKYGKFDIVIDGLCLHCITDSKDRKSYLGNVYKLLEDDGVFILLSMCSPVNKRLLADKFNEQVLEKKIVYRESKEVSYAGVKKIGGKCYLPSRYLGHWRDILGEVCKVGLEPKLLRINSQNTKEPCGALMVGAVKHR